ncbi:MAG: barstar family protein [Pyrinomonadaceae bacterium]|nr:barstar family protein [Pyrinomonadaceae bacterium]
MSKRIYEIDGNNFSTLEEFWDEISRVLIPDVYWGRNLDAFNDILRGGFGTPEEGFILVWKNSSLSRERLGYAETTRQLEKRLERCHPTNRDSVKLQIEESKQNKFPTVFEWLVEIIEYEEHDDIELRLE